MQVAKILEKRLNWETKIFQIIIFFYAVEFKSSFWNSNIVVWHIGNTDWDMVV